MKISNRQDFNFSNVSNVRDVGNVHVGRDEGETPTVPVERQRLSVLLVLTNPKGTRGLRLGEEERVIRQCLKAEGATEIDLNVRHAGRVDDVQAALLDNTFQLVQLSGHGMDGALLMEDEIGETHRVPMEALLSYLAGQDPPIECVVLNACATGVEASSMAAFAVVIAMEHQVSDAAAIEFSRGFYRGLRAGLDPVAAYGEGCHGVRLKGFTETPRLFRYGASVSPPGAD